MSLPFSEAVFPSSLVSSSSGMINPAAESLELAKAASTVLGLAVRAMPLQTSAAAMKRDTKALLVETTGAQFMGFSRRFVLWSTEKQRLNAKTIRGHDIQSRRW